VRDVGLHVNMTLHIFVVVVTHGYWLVLHYIKSGFRCPALEAMRKAHDVELEKERTKFLDLFAKTHSTADLESLQKQHEYDARLL